jgi:predicted enzyme related to lactoylglutathione lyase
VDDVEAALAQAESLGATRMVGPMDIPGGGTIGMFSDPQGHVIGVHHGQM